MKKTDRLVGGKLGEILTRRFLKSKHVKMVSEGDYISRLRSCCKVIYTMPIQAIWVIFYFYARFAVQSQMKNPTIPESELWLYADQINVLNTFMTIQIYHLFIMSSVLIVMLNMTMSKGTSIFTAIFNTLYISEALLYGSFLFVLDWVGILHKFKSPLELLMALRTQWIWIIAIFIAVFTFLPLRSVFKDVNMWNREWIRIERYRKTEDRENGFIFKTWVTPGEIKSRRLMIITGWFCIFSASVFHLMDVFARTDFNVIKYIILVAGYLIFLSAYVIPYNNWSLIFYWANQIFLFGLITYSLYMVQNVAWQYLMWYMYLYLILLVPWIISLTAAIRYTWTLKDKEEIKAVVLNMFEDKDDFEQYLDQRDEEQQIKESENTI
ncbi:hypothetical protein [Spiroplasma diminutum]|uniref:Transmembrane protein n=1 Tax=Spiroplasma diminutum CUAS-1 TaxID=1276221 RepID=S5M0C0_9MOLU|nr:hypothetical protein [Spiroplasma diminutum]AGR42291.1 hypothetical protein SDIMI_v3c05870 [Spiroplasma diminutum CUAS-1]